MLTVINWIERELENWAADCNFGPPVYPPRLDCAASIEGRYVSESVYELEYAQDVTAGRNPKPDAARAAVVQRVWETQLSSREKWILVRRYICAEPRRTTIRILRITTAIYEAALLAAFRRIDAAFGPKAMSLCYSPGK